MGLFDYITVEVPPIAVGGEAVEFQSKDLSDWPYMEHYAIRRVDCGVPASGRAWRCAVHQQARQDQAIRDYRENHREELGAKALARVQARTPEERQAANEYKRGWRRRNRRKVLMQKRRARLSGKPGGYVSREKLAAYQRAYRERNGEVLRTKARARRRATRSAA